MKKSSVQKKLVILDAHAIIHRAYHALPAFTNSRGVPTGALYGVVSMLLRIIEELKPTAIVAAFDLPKPTFRHHVYAEYKGTRAKSDDDLVMQLTAARELFEAFGVPVLDAEGFEADDVIGTLVEAHKKDKDLSIVIASGDMDTLQLVEGTRVQVFTLKKGINDTVLYDEEAVRMRYGFEPHQLIDYKGLRGDPSDNIIGVPGIGEKTATTIIRTYGSIEGLYKALKKNKKIEGVSDRIAQLLRDHEEDALFSKTLATIRRDAPVVYTIPQKGYLDTINEDSVREVLNEYEFRSLLARVQKIFHFASTQEAAPTDEGELLRAGVALWVLHSDMTTPTFDQILSATRTTTLPEAQKVLMEELTKKNLLEVYERIELPLIPIIQRMRERGIAIDRAYFEKLRDTMARDLAEIERQVFAITNTVVNLNSPKQLSTLLFTTLGLKPKGKQKESGAYTTNAEVLESLREAHPVVALILSHREKQKLLSTYIEPLIAAQQQDGRVHARFFQHGASTGRFSSADPNLQNIPIKSEAGREIRHGFVASPQHSFISSDYSQIELRVLAILSKDKALQETFERGEDIHTRVAATVFGVMPDAVTADMRRRAKVINFGIIYGMGVTALQKNLGTTREEAQKFYADYFAAFPTIAAYLNDTKEYAKVHGYTETLFGRRRYFPGIQSGAPFVRAMAERMATNAPIQGTAADIIKIAIVLVDHAITKAGLAQKAHLVLQIHDELIYEVENDVRDQVAALIKKEMSSVFAQSPLEVSEGSVPLEVSSAYGERLDELK